MKGHGDQTNFKELFRLIGIGEEALFVTTTAYFELRFGFLSPSAFVTCAVSGAIDPS